MSENGASDLEEIEAKKEERKRGRGGGWGSEGFLEKEVKRRTN